MIYVTESIFMLFPAKEGARGCSKLLVFYKSILSKQATKHLPVCQIENSFHSSLPPHPPWFPSSWILSDLLVLLCSLCFCSIKCDLAFFIDIGPQYDYRISKRYICGGEKWYLGGLFSLTFSLEAYLYMFWSFLKLSYLKPPYIGFFYI